MEIITEDQQFKCFPISPVDTSFAKWDKLQRAILRESNIWDWTSLECWRMGTSSDLKQNAITIIVSVQKSTNHDFHTDRAKSWRILFMEDRPKFNAGG